MYKSLLDSEPQKLFLSLSVFFIDPRIVKLVQPIAAWGVFSSFSFDIVRQYTQECRTQARRL